MFLLFDILANDRFDLRWTDFRHLLSPTKEHSNVNDGNMLLIRIYNVNFVAQYINAQKGYTQFILGDVMT